MVSSYIRLTWAVYSGVVRGEVVTKSGMCCVGWVLWVHGGSAVYVVGTWGFCCYMLWVHGGSAVICYV